MTWTNFLKDVISPGDLMHKDTDHVLMITDSTASAQLSPLNLRLPFSTAYQIFPPGSPHTSETQHPGQNLLIFPPPPSLIFSTSLHGTCFHQVTQARNFRVFPGPSLPLNPHPQPFTKPCRPVIQSLPPPTSQGRWIWENTQEPPVSAYRHMSSSTHTHPPVMRRFLPIL